MNDEIISTDETYGNYYEPKSRTESRISAFEDESPPHAVEKKQSYRQNSLRRIFDTSRLVEAVNLKEKKRATALWDTTKCQPWIFRNAYIRG